jgi:hypothetical protein
MVADFSEPERRFEPVGGYRSDNLISNERSIQEVLPELRQRRRTGAYIGVGPEQNFTYVVTLAAWCGDVKAPEAGNGVH